MRHLATIIMAAVVLASLGCELNTPQPGAPMPHDCDDGQTCNVTESGAWLGSWPEDCAGDACRAPCLEVGLPCYDEMQICAYIEPIDDLRCVPLVCSEK